MKWVGGRSCRYSCDNNVTVDVLREKKNCFCSLYVADINSGAYSPEELKPSCLGSPQALHGQAWRAQRQHLKNTARALAASSWAETNRMGYGCAVDHCSINQLRSKWSLLRGLFGLCSQPSKTSKMGCTL